MTTKKINAITEKKLGKDITEQETQDLDGKIALPDEALDIVSGGEGKGACPMCGESNLRYSLHFDRVYCGSCAYTFTSNAVSMALRTDKCPMCKQSALNYSFKAGRLECGVCGYSNTQEFHEIFLIP